MSSPRKLVFDFDGTLVLENSSRLLVAELFKRRTTIMQRVGYAMIYGRLKPFGYVVFGAFSRVLDGRDMRLMFTLWLYRSHIRHDGGDVFRKVARRLTLNTTLANDYVKPFIILSTGMSPIIEAWLALHPVLTCTNVVASTYGQQYGRLITVGAKVAPLTAIDNFVYFTDYDHEAYLVRNAFANRCRMEQVDRLYRLETTS